MRRSHLGAAVALLLVFAAGVAGGVALERLWLDADSGAEAARSDRGYRDHRPVIERFSEELELTADQQAKIDTIVDGLQQRMRDMWAEARPRYRAMVDSAKARIEAVLTEEQVEKYRELLEREAERRERRWGEDDSARDAGGSTESVHDTGSAP